MNRLADIEGRIGSMSELLNIVGALRSLAGMRVQEAQRALPGIRRYAQSMAEAVGSALLLTPGSETSKGNGNGRKALVLCASEHGFVGGFNERLIEAAEAALKAGDRLFVLGGRGAMFAAERGRPVLWSRPMATKPGSAPRMVGELIASLYSHIANGEFSRVEVMFFRNAQGGGSNIERTQILPLDAASLVPKQSRQAPLHNLKADRLFQSLTAEYVFAKLTEAAVESIASENAARFAAMNSAHGNVSKKLDQLRQEARVARQEEITAELLDLVTGAEASENNSPESGKAQFKV
jgi:F-type H+-transporting ATPase subunit gamma